ncbi:hypothetical protein J2X69_003723 [Algoriphagus sp. 4150]|nr:hypothetical protein [Algoriphagus sp. 4150]
MDVGLRVIDVDSIIKFSQLLNVFDSKETKTI